jgi:N-acetyl-1-D-myo-inositol-2-amino-2-deoxy-alpha-D-glucopyranoside deacetylase
MSEKAPTLLIVMAHPDDESFGAGGTLAYYARRGVKVYLVCATRGEVGDVDPEFMRGYDTIAELREAELRCAAGTLGLEEVFFLDYRDSGMPGSEDNHHPRALAAQPTQQVAGEVAGFIRQLQPDVLVTFDPIGGYRHPDHIAIHNATVEAFKLAADPAYQDNEWLPAFQPAKFYYQTMPRGFLKLVVRLMRFAGRNPHQFGRNKDIDLAAIANVDFPTNAVIRYGAVADIRDAAAKCHASQGGASLSGGWLAPLRRLVMAKEIYMRAYPPANGKVETDLFAGVANLPPLLR